MKGGLIHIIKLVFLVLTWTLQPMDIEAQEINAPYYFEEEDVVFVFDLRTYAKALMGENALKADFADLGIYEVAVTGQFNNWNKKGWKMTKRDEFTFELRKRIHDFNDAFPLDFRYIINGRYIADAEGQITDTRQFEDNFLEDIYKVDLSVIKIVEEGNVLFFLNEHFDAQEVILSGTFNGWNERELKMNKVATGWELHAELPPGRYEYKFIVDGEWKHDPLNKETVRNEHHTLNSVLLITLPVTITLKGFTDARTIVLTGSFNNWHEKKLQMDRTGEGWTATVNMPGGKNTYKFIVDGKWINDPDNPIIEDDGHGNKNSVLFVH